jgi:hypothetical protein
LVIKTIAGETPKYSIIWFTEQLAVTFEKIKKLPFILDVCSRETLLFEDAI